MCFSITTYHKLSLRIIENYKYILAQYINLGYFGLIYQLTSARTADSFSMKEKLGNMAAGTTVPVRTVALDSIDV